MRCVEGLRRPLLARLLLLLEAEACPPAQLPLLLGEVVGPRCAGPRLQNVVHLKVKEQLVVCEFEFRH